MPEQPSPYLYSTAAVLDSIPKPGRWKKSFHGNQRTHKTQDLLQQFLDQVVWQELQETRVAASPEVIEPMVVTNSYDEEVARISCNAATPRAEPLKPSPPLGERPRSGIARCPQARMSGADKTGVCGRLPSAGSDVSSRNRILQWQHTAIEPCRPSSAARSSPRPQSAHARLRRLGRAYDEDTFVPRSSPPSPRRQHPRSTRVNAASITNIGDELFEKVVKPLIDALKMYFAKKPMKTHWSWAKFFQEMDEDKSGLVTFDELAAAAQNRLGSPITRYELRMLWHRLDRDGSGQATQAEFEQIIHSIEMLKWPVLTPKQLSTFIKKLNDAAEKWHGCGGNWFKIFELIDLDSSGGISYCELEHCIRGSFPNFRMSKAVISDNEIKGFWKALAGVQNLTVPISRFMRFLRQQGSLIGINFHKQAAHSNNCLGIQDKTDESTLTAAKNTDELRAIVATMEKALFAYYKAQGFKGFMLRTGAMAMASAVTGKDSGLFTRFFRELDTDNGGRLSFAEVEAGLKSKLGVYLETAGVSKENVKSLLAAMDTDCSGETSRKEMLLYLYRLELETWPKSTETELAKVIGVMEHALVQRFTSGGSWYNLFRLVDKGRTNMLVLEDVIDMIRSCTNGLNISLQQLSESDIRGLWRGLDCNLSGSVTLAEFMIFMRKHGQRHPVDRHAADSTEKQVLKNTQDCAEITDKTASDSEQPRTRRDLHNIAKLLTGAITSYWHRLGERVTSRDVWERFLKDADLNRSSHLTLGLLTYHLQQRISNAPHPPNSPLGKNSTASSPRSSPKNLSCSQAFKPFSLPPGDTIVVKSVSQNDLSALWEFVDHKYCGKTNVHEWCTSMYHLELESCPDLSSSRIHRIVEIISKKTLKRTSTRANWWGLLRLIDFDSSASIGIEELISIIRRPSPCLEINETEISDQEIHGLWKAMDTDRCGCVSRDEFMVFMRRMDVKRGEDSKLSRAKMTIVERASVSMLASSSRNLGSKSIEFPEFSENLNTDAFEEAYASWGQEWKGYVTEWMWPKVARDILGIPDTVSSDDLHAAWVSWDVEGDGRLPLELLLTGEDLRN
eukprot:TRINITY_DN1420_c0_g3_i1.p1 TRINITY_DN1420_c0_g3~~TRINITY_DN1420_c0_g3_i1.p1  ORF type:complete len:1071 (+),score=140.28 TRINITY_DN1420_c0_g3_i1:278-3490(+)